MKLVRSSKNPILLPLDHPWENKAVFNPGVFEYQGHLHLLYRAQGNDNISRLGLVKMSDPTTVTERQAEPIFSPDPDTEYEKSGVEDPRVVKIGDTYYIIYVAASKYPRDFVNDKSGYSDEWRVRVSLSHTHDFKVFTRHGVIISHIDSKDASLFPEKINNEFILIHRIIPAIRIAVSENFLRYKERGTLFGPRPGTWESSKVGIGAPPIRSPYGWILFYHGVDDQQVYRLGLALLDLNDPTIVLGRYPEPILEPIEAYEKDGLVKNVTFACGAYETNDEYLVYYGAADSCIGLATIKKQEVFNWAKEHQTVDKSILGDIPMRENP